MIGHPALPGRRLAFGVTVVLNLSDEPVTLRAARFANADPGLVVEDAFVLGPGRRIGASSSFDPFPGRGTRTAGVPLEPLDGCDYVDLTYEQNGTTYREFLPRSFALCVARNAARFELDCTDEPPPPPLPPIRDGSLIEAPEPS